MLERTILSQIAEDYYLNKLPFGDISKKYNISRYLVNKYLNEAVKVGIVKIEITENSNRNPQIENILRDKFKDINFYVVQDDINNITTSEHLANFAATYVDEVLQDNNKIVGLTWGETIYTMIDSLKNRPLERVKFTQFLGENMKYNSTAGSMRMVERAAKKVSGEFLTLPAPLYILNDSVRNGLYSEPSLQNTIAVADNMDALITGVGTILSLDSIAIWKQNLNAIFSTVNTQEIAGLIYGRPYDINGRFLNLEADKVLGLSIDQILKVPKRICLVRGKSKYKPVIGAIKGKLITDVIMTEGMAYKILNETS
ncbi:sugar-binding transcriptional regulator [Leuconostoc mesenteroides]|uniref:sugar-binding transcriptional regulator n=1 Tax=Leuconostoc mesenteroides TaxID=1245 RepID=UPI000B9D61DC|nr:sugar-binding domain-containing protein [Leuconostoc mesenteroides]BAX72644.1 citrate lyase regulator [Leuconostoc mesenteroides]